jgi:hypothetical protein
MPKYPNFARCYFHVDPTATGIRATNTLDDEDGTPLNGLDEDSDFDENLEILDLERRDFDDVDDIDSDME